MKRVFGAVMFTLFAIPLIGFAAESSEEGFVQLFDGKTLNGWKINEKPGSWDVKDGAIVANGDRSHLFFIGNEKTTPEFVNFELRVDVMTEKNSNGGIYFHTKFQPEGWPAVGFESQVNNSFDADFRRTGSLYRVVDLKEKIVPDNEWYTETVIVKGKNIKIKVNDKVVVDYDEPADKKPDADCTRVLDKGTFAFQAHDPGSTVRYKNIRVKRLD